VRRSAWNLLFPPLVLAVGGLAWLGLARGVHALHARPDGLPFPLVRSGLAGLLMFTPICLPAVVLGLLGAGAMGEVYRARDESLGRQVAIKVLPARFSADPERMRRFDVEARAAGTVATAGRGASPTLASRACRSATWPTTIVAATADDGSHTFSVPGVPCSTHARFRVVVRDVDGNTGYDSSTSDLTITGQPCLGDMNCDERPLGSSGKK